jgi:mono/diheme cytochrome c family protein
MRPALAAVVVIVMGGAIAGAGIGEATAERERPPSPAAVAAAEQRIAALAPQGVRLFSDEGCDRCHAIAAIDAEGRLGPRLDMLDDDAEDVAESIADPRDDIEDGYPEKLMPADFAQRLSASEIRALARLVAAASGTRDEDDDEDEERRSGRGRGRSGEG